MPKMRVSFSASTRAAVSIACALGLAWGASGCGQTCDTSDDGNPPERYEGGKTSNGLVADSGVSTGPLYESSPYSSGRLHFPGGKRYDLVHNLGFVPATVQIWWAFSENDGPISLGTGNAAEVECKDDQVIRIKNDTCTEFWVYVTASDASVEPPGSSCK